MFTVTQLPRYYPALQEILNNKDCLTVRTPPGEAHKGYTALMTVASLPCPLFIQEVVVDNTPESLINDGTERSQATPLHMAVTDNKRFLIGCVRCCNGSFVSVSCGASEGAVNSLGLQICNSSLEARNSHHG